MGCNVPPEISIIIPTYNPQERLLSRVLNAVESLSAKGQSSTECVIVDNRSDPPLLERPYIQEFLHRVQGSRVVWEGTQGLAFARLAGIRATSGRVLVMFDDDNVPAPGYLRAVAHCMRDYPFVGVWGPGNVEVELVDPVPAWLRQRVKAQHGQKSIRHVQYGHVWGSWCQFYPHGMGQVVQREVAEAYLDRVERGRLTATGRRGASLASGEDIQIVWQAINMGLAAGIHPDLAITHLIPESRASFRYLQRLAFGCAMSYDPALAQSFPDAYKDGRHTPRAWQDGSAMLRFVLGHLARGRVRFLPVEFASVLGLMCGRVVANGFDTGHWTFRLARRLGLT